MPANDVRKYQASGFYRDIDLQDPSNDDSDTVQDKIDEIDGRKKVYTKDDIYTILEIHTDPVTKMPMRQVKCLVSVCLTL